MLAILYGLMRLVLELVTSGGMKLLMEFKLVTFYYTHQFVLAAVYELHRAVKL